MSGAVKAISNTFSSIFNPKAPKIPTPDRPIVAADPNSAAAKQATIQKARQRAQKGREGTIYSQSYGNANLAGTA